MVSTWQTITLPSTVTSGGTFSPDVMLLLTDGSVFIHNRGGNEWLRFYPDPLSGYAGGAWSTKFTESDMANTRQYFASGVLKDGRVFAIGGFLLLPTGQLLCACASFDPSFFTLPGPLLLYTFIKQTNKHETNFG
jgi:hypothetical protein